MRRPREAVGVEGLLNTKAGVGERASFTASGGAGVRGRVAALRHLVDDGNPFQESFPLSYRQRRNQSRRGGKRGPSSTVIDRVPSAGRAGIKSSAK
jgi:hypothetical protein